MNQPLPPERHYPIKSSNARENAESWLEIEGAFVHFRSQHSLDPGVIGGGTSWKRCAHHNCVGAARDDSPVCITHQSEQSRKEFFDQCATSIGFLVLQGVTVNQAIWNEITASRIFDGATLRIPIELRHAKIDAKINLQNAKFDRIFWLSNCIINEEIIITDSLFNEGVIFESCLINGVVIRLSGSTFHHRANFSKSTHSEELQYNKGIIALEKCIFNDDLILEETTATIFADSAKFTKNINCRNSKLSLGIHGSHLNGSLDVENSECSIGAPRLHAARSLRLNNAKIAHLDLQDAIFDSHIYVNAVCEDINLLGVELRKGGAFDVQAKTICLSQIRTGGSLKIRGKPGSTQTEIIDLTNADVNHMSLTNVNLRRCSFYGAHGLSSIELDPSVSLATTRFPLGKRRYIADELAWRRSRPRWLSLGWQIDDTFVGQSAPPQKKWPPKRIVVLKPRSALEVATTYRDIRRSFESRSDMSGAADFYYGEMEMRRHWARFAEKEMLTIYKYISGYGLKPLNAFAGWTLAIVTATSLIHSNSLLGEFTPIGESLIFTIRASIPGIQTIPKDLTTSLLAIETALRIWGTFTGAMFVLAIRNRLLRKPSE